MEDIFDDELKAVMAHRYQEDGHNFTREAQARRRNNRLKFTYRISALLGVIAGFVIWANRSGLMPFGVAAFGLITCGVAVGYNAAVCVCHNQGWRGA